MDNEKRDYLQERKRMVDEQIARRGLRNSRLLAAMEIVPRHRFVREEDLPWAYADGPLPIGYGQTISQPFIVALMTDMLQLLGGEKILEVGTGSGYQAAVLAQIAGEIHTVEIVPQLAKRAETVISVLGYDHVHIHLGDGSLGWQEDAPYDGILVAAAAPDVPRPLLEQLSEGGRLVLPVGREYGFQKLETWKRTGTKFNREVGIAVAFVPLRGAHGW